MEKIGNLSVEKAYELISTYIEATADVFPGEDSYQKYITKPNQVKAIIGFFPSVAKRIKLTHGADYTYDNFHAVLDDVYSNVQKSKLTSSKGYKTLLNHLNSVLDNNFELF